MSNDTMTEKEVSISATPIEDADPVIQSVFSRSRAVYGTPGENKAVSSCLSCCGPKGGSVEFHHLMDAP